MLLFLQSTGVLGEPSEPVRLSEKDYISLGLHVDVLKDVTGILTIRDIQQAKYQKVFVRNNDMIPNYGLSNASYWLRFSLYNPYKSSLSNSNLQQYLVVGRALLDVAELYSPNNNGSYDMQRSDLSMDFSDRPVRHSNSIFPITLNKEEHNVFYLKVQSSSILFLPLSIQTTTSLIDTFLSEEFYYGIYFGTLLILILFNVFIYALLQEKMYLYYIAYLVSVVLFQLVETGHGAIESGWIFLALGKKSLVFTIWLATAFAILFFREYILSNTHKPIIEYFVRIALSIILVSAAISPFIGYAIALYWASVFSVCFLLSILTISWALMREGDENASLFFFAWIFNVLGFVVYSLMANTIIVVNMFTIHSIEIGIVLELTILSLAMAEKIKRSRHFSLTLNQRSVSRLKKYKAIFHNSQDGKYEMSMKGVIRVVNPAAVRMLGYFSAKKLLKNNKNVALQLLGDNEFAALLLLKDRVFRNEIAITSEVGSRQRWVNHTSRLIKQSQGLPSYIEGTIIDITDEKERDIAKAMKDAEQLEKQIAIVASQHKSQFLSAMSHHIRDPLTAIVGYSELLRDGEISDRVKSEYTQIVVDKSNELLRLINNILDYSKIAAKKLDIESIPVNVIELVDQVHSQCSKIALDKSLGFDVKIEYPIPKNIMADPVRINQVLQNLCENAIKFTKKGTVILSVLFRDDAIVFSVSDTGKGIKQKRIEGLFDQESLIARGSFGLAISKSLALKMNGDITVKAREDKGCTFQFSIPISSYKGWVKSRAQKNVNTNEGSKIKPTVPILSGVVLVAEDNVVNQKLIKRVIEKTKASVVIVDNGVEACEYFDQHLCEKDMPDLVLMDINMPLRNGIDATRQLRERGVKVPIFALTAETDKSEIIKAKDAGCDGVLSKPLNKQHLYDVLVKHLSNAPSA